MKKVLITLLLVAAMICGYAMAEGKLGQGSEVARMSELAAFIGNNGHIYISGDGDAVNSTSAKSVLSIDPYRIVFFAEDGGLYSLDLNDDSETLIVSNVYAACVLDDSVFYVTDADRYSLVKYDFDDRSTAKAYTATEQLDVVYATMNGVIMTTVENSGAFMLDTDSMKTVSYSGEIASEIRRFDDFDVYSTSAGVLYTLREGAFFADTVDSNVRDWTVIGSTVYYLAGTDGNIKLKSWNVSDSTRKEICTVSNNYSIQLTASRSKLFMIDSSYKVYTVNTNTGDTTMFATLSDPSSYAVGDNAKLTGYTLEGVSGQLNVYGNKESKEDQPTFSFVTFTSDTASSDNTAKILISAYKVDGESTVKDMLQPVEVTTTPQVTLRKGSRGEAVSAIQDPLYDHGYYDYKIDGIFGWRTERAVRLLQEQLGYVVTGAATPELQELIIADDIPDYDPYMSLRRGNSGPRVLAMQQRLRELGYLADDADSIFGVRTEKAVTLFQEENGLSSTGIADRETLKKLFSDSADTCSSYIDLERGDSGWRVRELNERLKELYYLDGKAGNTYTSATAAAVRRFQEQVGLRVTGKATAAVQKKLFSRNAPEYDGYITLRRGDDNERVVTLQERLKQLGYYDGSCDGYFDRRTEEAVRKFQRRVGLRDNGVADATTQDALYDPDAPYYEEYEDISDPYISLSAYSSVVDDIYVIADGDTTGGGVTASYYADGDVENYDVKIYDDIGNVYADVEETDETVVFIPVMQLDTERTYTIEVTAHPMDIAYDDTCSTIRFVRSIEEPEPEEHEIGTIESLVIMPSVDGDYTYENGTYVMDQKNMVFSWIATGNVQGYTYEVSDENDNILTSDAEISDTVSLDVTTYTLDENAIYTLIVNAIPTNGTIDDATSAVLSFRLKTQEDVEAAELAPKDTEEPTDEQAEAPEETAEAQETPNAEETLTPESMVTEVPAETLGIPEISMSPEKETYNAEFNGQTVEVHEPEGDSVVFSWPSENATEYRIKITDSNGNVMNESSTDAAQSNLSTSGMVAGQVYCLSVTAISESGAQTENNYYFGVRAQGDAETDATEETQDAEAASEPQEEEPAVADEDSDTGTEADEGFEETEAASAPIGVPMISIDPENGSFFGDYSGESVEAVIPDADKFTISWPAEGNVGSYDIKITDVDGNVVVDQSIAQTAATLEKNMLQSGMVYCIEVTANSADGTQQSNAVAYFGIPAEGSEADANTSDNDNDPDEDVGVTEDLSDDEEDSDEGEDETDGDPEYDDQGETADDGEYDDQEDVADEDDYDDLDETSDDGEYDDQEDVTEDDEYVDQGDNGTDIGAVQNFLVNNGYLQSGTYTDGMLDNATVAALIAYQQQNGLAECDSNDPAVSAETLSAMGLA